MNTFFPNPETPFSLPSCSDVTLGQTASGEEEFGDKEKEPGPGNALTLQSRAVHHSQALPGRTEASKDKAAAPRSVSQRGLQTLLLISKEKSFISCEQLTPQSPTTRSRVLFILKAAFY